MSVADEGRAVEAAVRRPSRAEVRRRLGAVVGDFDLLIGATIVAVVVIVAIAAPLLEPYGPLTLGPSHELAAPGGAHWFGTDELGRDELSRVLAGARYSLPGGCGVVAIGVIVGTFVGLIAGFVGGWVDEILMRITDMFLAFPSLILAMAVSASLGPSFENAVIAIGLVWWPWYARLVRGQTLRVRSREFVTAAVVAGAKRRHIIRDHILRNVWGPVVVQMSMDVGYAILTLAGLSFIGLGAQPPTPEWGALISDGRNYLSQWWLVTIPGLAIVFTVAGFILLADGVERLLPRSGGTT